MRHLSAAALAVLFALPAQASLVIANKPSKNMDCVSTPGECRATDADAVLNTDELAGLLAASDLRVVTDGLFFQDVEVNSPVSWASSHELTIHSNDALYLASTITVQGTAALELDVPGGPIYRKKGAIKFWDAASKLTIDGDNYRLVATLADLAAAIAKRPHGRYALANDYNAKGDGQVRRVPIQTPVRGIVDGLGNVVSNFWIWDVEDNNIALFESVNPHGTIRNLGMAKVNILAENTFNNVAGALVGFNAGTVLNCYADGGTVRTDFRGTIGGLIGQNYGNVYGSWANVSVEGAQGGAAGGLIGNAHGHVQNVYALGRVIAGDQVDIGGLIGYNFGHVRDGYATGHVSGGQNADVGGVMGISQLPIQELYWDVETSGTSFGVGGHDFEGATGLTTEQLKSGLPAGFSPSIWGQSAKVNGGLPYLLGSQAKQRGAGSR